jgi:hypothetical protein
MIEIESAKNRFFLSIYLLGGGALLNSRAPKGPYGRAPLLSLSVEPPLLSLSLSVEPLSLLVERATHPDGPYGRAP